MYLVSSITYIAVEKVWNAWYSPMPTRGTLEAFFLSSLCDQAVRSHAPKSLAPGHPSGFQHASSTETLYSRHLVSSLQIPQETASACPTSLRPFLTITAQFLSLENLLWLTLLWDRLKLTAWSTHLTSSLFHSTNIYCDSSENLIQRI